MLGKEFRSLAEAVTHTYGGNPWFFLRELAQNSRDAGARSITVMAETTASGFEVLTFADDGRGMSRIHARRFLFRLYASDKVNDKTSAGKYGIGFWTILGFQPGRITLQSRHKKESWAVVLDADLEARPAPCTLARPGTIVSLSRKAVFSSAAGFAGTVEKELRAHCQYLRRNDRQGSMLPVFFQGRNITVPITLPGPLSHSFHDGAVEGAVGLGEKPLVRLYARGLPVWEGAVLEQMSHLQNQPAVQSEIGRGLAPVFLLNGNNLDVTFSRNLVQENKAMEKVRKSAEKALRRLLANAMEKAFPRKWTQRGGDRLKAFFSHFGRPGWKLLTLVFLVVLPLEILILSRFFPIHVRPGPSPFDLNYASIQYAGASVGNSVSELSARFTYAPPIPSWFRVFVAKKYDLQAGFVWSADAVLSPPPPFPSCEPNKIVRMQFPVSKAGQTLLPLPPGHAIDPTSVFYSRQTQRLVLSVNVQGERSVQIPGNGLGVLSYRSCPQPAEQGLAPAAVARLVWLPPELAWPEELERSLIEARSLRVGEKVARASALVRALIRFDASEPTIRSYRQNASSPQWLARVLAIGKGDCDVINGVHVLCLRKMGLPARLAIGLVGDQGRIQPGLHAWSEYFDNGWQVADASDGPTAAAPPVPAPQSGSPVENNRTVPSAAPSGLGRVLMPALWVILLTAAWILLKKSKARRSLKVAQSMPATRELLLPVIQQALLQPELWGRNSPLWNHHFLPTLNGKPMTIRRALALQRRLMLRLATGRNPLAEALSRGRLPVLDLSQECFSALRPLLSAAIDLDLLWQLQPRPVAAAGHKSDELLAAVNALLIKNKVRATRCLLAPELRESDFFFVSLPQAPRSNRFFFPQRFIAVNPAARPLAEATAVFEKNRPLAVFRFLQALNSESLLPVHDPQAFLRKTARRLLSGQQ